MITADPTEDPIGFISQLPRTEADCAAEAVGGRSRLANILALGEESSSELTVDEQTDLYGCFSDDTAARIVAGRLDTEAGGLGDASVSCVLEHTGDIGFAAISTSAITPENFLSMSMALFCLTPDERTAMESDDEGFGAGIAAFGGIDALECFFNSIGPENTDELSLIFDPEVSLFDTLAYFPLMYQCGLVDDSDFEGTPITAEQISCLVETDTVLAAEFLGYSFSGEEIPLELALLVLSALEGCGVDVSGLTGEP